MVYKSKLADLKFNLDTWIIFEDETGKDILEEFRGYDEKSHTGKVRFAKSLFIAGCKANGIAEIPSFDFAPADILPLVTAFAESLNVSGEVKENTQPEQAP